MTDNELIQIENDTFKNDIKNCFLTKAGMNVDPLYEIKSEAIKEFAERLKCKKATFYCNCGEEFDYTDILNAHIDNLVKEMVGDEK